ncbi:DNA alkylation repair enzyme [Poriferisphaera corsica]|uniref:DNA alkylation repair enzyme n=1 Tax=Poriferisphaera corsica TaxID=2528020 RepID=A0A517YYD7_9BACT|nr:DNA alkylation repair protein [Poriferisphaera corsica]QDU35234.1 DNA alkylation repair enzyme [Poriferisphaera corsica]
MDERIIVEKLRGMRDERAVVMGVQRFGIVTELEYLGVSMPRLRAMGKELKKELADRHEVAMRLWGYEVHEARIVASLIADPERMTVRLMNQWAGDFDSWAMVDVVVDLFGKTKEAWGRPRVWCGRREEFVRRAGFVMMCTLAVHDKEADDERFLEFFPLIKQHATDERNFVKKAVNWSIRQIGKRSLMLNREAVGLSEELLGMGDRTADWIARGAIRELQSEKILARLS